MRPSTIAFLIMCLALGVAIGPATAGWTVGPLDTSASDTGIDKTYWCAGEQATPSIAVWSSPNGETAAANCGNSNHNSLHWAKAYAQGVGTKTATCTCPLIDEPGDGSASHGSGTHQWTSDSTYPWFITRPHWNVWAQMYGKSNLVLNTDSDPGGPWSHDIHDANNSVPVPAGSVSDNVYDGNQAKLYYEVWSISDQNGVDYGVDAFSAIQGSGTLTFQVQ